MEDGQRIGAPGRGRTRGRSRGRGRGRARGRGHGRQTTLRGQRRGRGLGREHAQENRERYVSAIGQFVTTKTVTDSHRRTVAANKVDSGSDPVRADGAFEGGRPPPQTEPKSRRKVAVVIDEDSSDSDGGALASRKRAPGGTREDWASSNGGNDGVSPIRSCANSEASGQVSKKQKKSGKDTITQGDDEDKGGTLVKPQSSIDHDDMQLTSRGKPTTLASNGVRVDYNGEFKDAEDSECISKNAQDKISGADGAGNKLSGANDSDCDRGSSRGMPSKGRVHGKANGAKGGNIRRHGGNAGGISTSREDGDYDVDQDGDVEGDMSDEDDDSLLAAAAPVAPSPSRMTARQRGIASGEVTDMIDLDDLFPRKSKKRAKKAMSEEDEAERAARREENTLRRKMAQQRQQQEEQARTRQRILSKQAVNKNVSTISRGDAARQAAAVKRKRTSVGYIDGPSGRALTFPRGFDSDIRHPPCKPPEPIVCAAEGCQHLKSYTCVRTGLPLCSSLACYKQLQGENIRAQ